MADKHRKTPRLLLPENRKAFALIDSPAGKRLGPIIDISRGGLAFCYIDTPELRALSGHTAVVLFTSRQGFRITLPFEVVTDHQMPRTVSFSSIRIRRCSGKFGTLSPAQIADMSFFFQQFASAGGISGVSFLPADGRPKWG